MRKHLTAFFTHTSVWLLTLLSIAGLIFIGPRFGKGGVWLCLVIGAAVFFVSEYTTHRFLFHSKPSKNSFVQELKKRLHYDHHEYPQDLDLLFLPAWYSIPNFSLVFLLSWLFTHDTVFAAAVTTGGLLALLYYEWVHFRAHRSIVPFTPFGKAMKKYHLRHHYLNENYWFGVTNPSLDTIFGTRPNEKAVELSPTARNLHQTELHPKEQISPTSEVNNE